MDLLLCQSHNVHSINIRPAVSFEVGFIWKKSTKSEVQGAGTAGLGVLQIKNQYMASIVGKGDSEGLRKVEKDVLITKKVKHKAMELCNDLVKGKY